MCEYNCSERHETTRNLLMEFAEHSRSWADFERYLKKDSIAYEEINLSSGKQLLIYTGSSGYSIFGCAVKWKNGHFVVEDLYSQ